MTKAKTKSRRVWTIRLGANWWAAGEGNGLTGDPDKVWRMSRAEALRRARQAGLAAETQVVEAPPAKAKKRSAKR